MAVRIRTDGRILCAAMHPEEPGDTYLDDAIHYKLSAVLHVLVTEPMERHQNHGQWWWTDEVPASAEIERWWLTSDDPFTVLDPYTVVSNWADQCWVVIKRHGVNLVAVARFGVELGVQNGEREAREYAHWLNERSRLGNDRLPLPPAAGEKHS